MHALTVRRRVLVFGLLFRPKTISLEKECNLILEYFDRALIAGWLTSKRSNVAECAECQYFMSDALLLKLLVININSVHVLQSTGAEDSRYLECSIFLCLRIFAQMLAWYAQASSDTDSCIDHTTHLKTVKVGLQFLSSGSMVTLLRQRQGTPSVLKVWHATALCLNSLLSFTQNASTTALEEDFNLRGFAPLQQAHAKLTFDSEVMYKLESEQATTMRVAQILQLGHDLSTLVQFALVFNQSSRRFEVTSPDGAVGPPFVDAQVSLPTGMSTTGNSTQAQFQRERVMRAMAQQRLQSEVHTLESSLAAASGYAQTISPFVVLDTTCYTQSLHSVKELVRLKRFVIVVPLAVISTLDDLKKGNDKINKSAREATRFLEKVFKQGDTSLRAQQRDESADPPFEPDPGTPSETLRVLSCCIHFAHHTSERADMVTLLSSDQVLSGMAQRSGITTQRITAFMRKIKGR